jgi:hypothetical protein
MRKVRPSQSKGIPPWEEPIVGRSLGALWELSRALGCPRLRAGELDPVPDEEAFPYTILSPLPTAMEAPQLNG